MSWIDSLIDQGYVPGGVEPKRQISPGTKPDWYQNDALSRVERSLAVLLEERKQQETERQKRLKENADTYQTLRDAGYSPKDAMDSIKNQKLGMPTETTDGQEVSSLTTKGLERKKKELELTKLDIEVNQLQGKKYPKETLSLANDLRKEFNQDKVYKNYQEIQRGFKGLQEAYALAVNPDTKSRIAADQALGVLFQKMLDPESVVRESEYARTPEGAAAVSRIQSILPQLQKGGLRMSNEDRQALLETAKKLYTSGKELLDNHMNRYSQIANDYGVDTNLIFGGLDKLKNYVRTGVDKASGKKVGQLPDGSVEYIE